MRRFRMVRAGLWALASLLFLSMQLALPDRAHAAATVTAVSPTQGAATGGETVIITGTDFTNVLQVMFGNGDSAVFTVDSPTQITAITTPSAAGPVTVVVRTNAGASNGNVQFTYVPLLNVTALYNFRGGPNDGATPVGALVADRDGNLYGVTNRGGTRDMGTVFMLAAPGLTTRTILHNFGSRRDGAYPAMGMVIDNNGVLYGVTPAGGPGYAGVVFRLRPPANAAQKPNANAWRYDVLYAFKGGADGDRPSGLVLDPLGNIYGATYDGGSDGGGTLFKLTASGTAPWTKTRLHDFEWLTNPDGPLLIKDGNLVGTTRNGGRMDVGTVYSFGLTFGPSRLRPVVRYTFSARGGDGAYPASGMIVTRSNILYGTTSEGGRVSPGAVSSGTVVELKLVDGKWQRNVIAKDFTEDGNGVHPDGVVLGPGGALYGITTEGSFRLSGSLFKLSPPSGGQTQWAYRTLYHFGDPSFAGRYPNPIIMKGRTIYGTTENGGAGNCCGMVYKAEEQ